MAYIRLSDLRLGFKDLFDNRLIALRTSALGTAYEPLLRGKYGAIMALPETLTGTPLAEQLADEDARHDGFGGAALGLVLTYLEAPDTTPEQREALKRIQQTFVPGRMDLVAAYATEAANAQARLEKVEGMTADLELFPITGGRTLKDWVSSYIESGIKIGKLLGQRADIDNKADTELRKQAAVLRAQTLGLINQLREGIRQELETDSTLPANLEAQIFAYFDTLESMRASNASTTPATDSAPSDMPPAG